jgi:type VI secretion system protein ImpH
VVTPAGPTEYPLIRSLLAEGNRFNIYQALSLLERAYPDAPALGGTGPAAREIMRIRPDVSLGFPSGAIASIDWVDTAPAADTGFSLSTGNDGHYRVTATFFGLYGVDSPLPNHWSEEILYEQSQDTTVRDFLDIFHHRIYSLLFRIWTKYRYPVQYRLAGDDAFSKRFLALIGLGTADWQTAGLPVMRLLRYAGLLVQRPRSGAGLEAFLADWFEGIPIRVEPCAGRWIELGSGDLCRLGRSNSTLGDNAILGGRMFDVSGQFRLAMGPVDYPTYRRFLPDGSDHGTLRSLVNFFVTDRLEAELQLRLSGAEVPPLRLDPDDPPRLGWTTWLTSGQSPDMSAVFFLFATPPGTSGTARSPGDVSKN